MPRRYLEKQENSDWFLRKCNCDCKYAILIAIMQFTKNYEDDEDFYKKKKEVDCENAIDFFF